MHFTRRLLDPRRAPSALLAGALSAAAAASCTSSDDPVDPIATDDAGAGDAIAEASVDAPPDRGVAPFDGGPLPLTCASDPCAVALVTTRGAGAADRGEGFCALLRDGGVACWGAGSAGQLGRGDLVDAVDSALPERVTGLGKIVRLDHTCAVDEAGAAYCWGTGPFLRSADVATTTERTPVRLALPAAVDKVSVGHVAGCASGGGGIVCWGSNRHGQIAPFESERSTAVLTPRAIALPSGAPLRDLVVGDASFVVHAGGAVTSWGANPPLGRVSSLFPDPYPASMPMTNVMALDVADNNACAAIGGAGYCWGDDAAAPPEHGTDPPNIQRATPLQIVTPEPIVQIATVPATPASEPGAPTPAPPRWCAVTASGAVLCQGSNASGQAGDGSRDDAREAVRVVDLPETAREVRTTASSTCALLTSGKVYCWGGNYYGQLGNRAIKVSRLTPQEVQLP